MDGKQNIRSSTKYDMTTKSEIETTARYFVLIRSSISIFSDMYLAFVKENRKGSKK